jgi:hypothetical protein
MATCFYARSRLLPPDTLMFDHLAQARRHVAVGVCEWRISTRAVSPKTQPVPVSPERDRMKGCSQITCLQIVRETQLRKASTPSVRLRTLSGRAARPFGGYAQRSRGKSDIGHGFWSVARTRMPDGLTLQSNGQMRHHLKCRCLRQVSNLPYRSGSCCTPSGIGMSSDERRARPDAPSRGWRGRPDPQLPGKCARNP